MGRRFVIPTKERNPDEYTPIGENVLVKRKVLEDKTSGGIVIPENSMRSTIWHTFLRCGSQCDEDIKAIQPGTRVIVTEGPKHDSWIWQGEVYDVINWWDLAGIVTEAEVSK